MVRQKYFQKGTHEVFRINEIRLVGESDLTHGVEVEVVNFIGGLED